MTDQTKARVAAILPYVAWTQALVAMLSSLYMSEILHWTPCVLCWYQRILMYPLVVILGVGILRRDKKLYLYVLPLTILGLGIATYHHLLQIGVAPESLAPCMLGVSCKVRYGTWLGFMTIPFLSGIAFAVISICMWLTKIWGTDDE